MLKSVFDLALVLIAFVPSVVLNGFVQPYHRGFYCDDVTIRKPEVKQEFVPPVYLAILITLPPFVCICLVHLAMHTGRAKHERSTLDRVLNRILKDELLYLFGLGLTNSLVDVAKYTIGRLRPNFYSVCQPRLPLVNGSYVDCSLISPNDRLDSYIQNYHCSAQDSKNSHLSFMSGHSACAAYAMFFMAIFLQQIHGDLNRQQIYGRTLLQVFFVNVAAFVGFTRISDYMHHPVDVLVGLLSGTVFAFATLLLVASPKFRSKTTVAQNRSEPVNYRAEPMESVVYSF